MSKMHEIPEDLRSKELVFFDETNPRSLVRLLPEAVAKQVQLLNQGEMAHLLGLSEHDLYKELFRLKKKPQVVDNLLRVKFWTEYDRCQGLGDPLMKMTHIIGHTISRETFYKYYITDHRRLAWMLCPFIDYETAMKEALQLAVQKLRSIFESTEFEDGAKADSRKLDRFITAFRLLEERVNGIKRVPGGGQVGSRYDLAPKKKLSIPISQEEKTEFADSDVDSMEEQVKAARARVDALKAKKNQGGAT